MKIRFDRKVTFPFFISLIFALSIYYIIPYLQNRPFLSHLVISHYLTQCRIIILFLPLSILLYGIIPLRKTFNYETWLSFLKEKQFLLMAFFIAFVFTNLISFFLYDHLPQGDAVILFIQGKIFSKFQRWATPPLYSEFFLREMVISDGKWFSMMPPGHSILLAIGIFLHAPWIISPLLGSISIIILYYLTKEIYDEKFSKTVVLFLIFSPTFLFISSSMLSQNSSYFFSLLSISLLIRAIRKKREVLTFFSGICMGVAFLCRPQLSVLFFIISLFFSFSSTKKFRYPLFFLSGFLPFVLLQMLDNYILTGNPFHYGYHLYLSSGFHGLGFGETKGPPTYGISGHTPLKGIINLGYNLFVLSLHLFGFPLISLLFIPFSLRNPNKYDVLFLSFVLSSFLFWFLYWFHGVSPMGPKYYYETLPFLVILSVRGIHKIKFDIKPLVGILLIFNIFIYIPHNAKIFEIWGCNLYPYKKVKEKDIHHAIVFVKDVPRKIPFWRSLSKFNYFSLAIRNEIDIGKSDIIYAYDLGKENKKLMTLYPDRKAYILECKDVNIFELKELK